MLSPCRPALSFSLCLLLASPALSQTAPSAAPVFHGGTSLVLVDVTVTDGHGNPVPNLHASDFTLTDAKTPQTIRNFEQHSGSLSSPASPLHTPGILTNEISGPSSGPVDVLLIDALNTPLGSSQIFLRDQLLAYLKQAPAGRRVAIFALGSELRLLQTFTTDPDLLRAAITKSGRSSAVVQASGSDASMERTAGEQYQNLQDRTSQPGSRQAIKNLMESLKEMDTRRKSVETASRVRITLNAFNLIARYLGDLPGHKSLLWFSGSFPVTITRDPSATGDPFVGSQDLGPLFQKSISLLAQNQIAVYPIDSRGLELAPSANRVSDPDAAFVGNVDHMRNSAGSTSLLPEDTLFAKNNAEEHATMEQIADATGGLALFNTNDLVGAVNQALQHGAVWYTLAYTPSDTRENGAFHPIHLSLRQSGLHLAYRRGYYADHPAAVSSGQGSLPSALRWQSPPASEILFSVRALPGKVPVVSPLSYAVPNQRDRYTLTFGIDPGSIGFTPAPKEQRHASIDFVFVAFDTAGKQVESHADRVTLDLSPQKYAAIMNSGLRFEQQISLPQQSDLTVRLAVHDETSDRVGTLDVSAEALRQSLLQATSHPATPVRPLQSRPSHP